MRLLGAFLDTHRLKPCLKCGAKPEVRVVPPQPGHEKGGMGLRCQCGQHTEEFVTRKKDPERSFRLARRRWQRRNHVREAA